MTLAAPARSIRSRFANIAVAASAVLAIAGCHGRDRGGDDDGPPVTAGDASTADPCRDLVCVTTLPARLQGTTLTASRDVFEQYGCGGATALGGAEVVHRVTLSGEGFLGASKSVTAPNGTVVRLLRSLDPNDCVDAHERNVGARLPAGEYYVVVDSPEGMGGEFDVSIAFSDAASLQAHGVGAELARDAITAISNAWKWGATRRTEYVIVDFTMRSDTNRQWVVDLATGELLWNVRVAHGRNSTDGVDLAHAVTFSNTPGSNQSSLGVVRTAGTYTGTFGPSFRLEGLEPDFNDNVCDRDIVMHPWSPMGDDYVERCGHARPSLGCPAIDSTISMPVRDRLARPDGVGLEEGVIMLFWYPGTDWHAGSQYLHASDLNSAGRALYAVECDSSADGTPRPPTSGAYDCN